ncbi:MAG: glycosyltransferase family 4 protein [Syntrophorhabdaceae bacterium]
MLITTISSAFLVALLFGVLLTPIAGWLGKRFGALDKPNSRKVHTSAIPRSGGMAIIAAFFLGHFLLFLAGILLGHFAVNWANYAFFWLGALFVTGIGIIDDFRRVRSSVKLLFQILAATVAFLGGMRIEVFGIIEASWHFSYISSYLLTVFWFVLLINAINLIDGLDGLAAGVSIFACAVMTTLMTIEGQEKGAIAFAAVTGGTLGFLRYNFNPARIFMGDGGSYFLGYALAFFSIQYGAKSHVGLSLLIPLLALGIPIFDVIVSPIRRFVVGQKIFKADKRHIHHKLLAMGLTTKRAVILLYTISSILALSALLLVNLRNEEAGIIFFFLGIAAILFVRKLGYFEYFALEKIFGWLHDIRDVSGLTRSRRAFLGVEINIRESQTLDEMWEYVCVALEMKRFHKGWLHLYDQGHDGTKSRSLYDVSIPNIDIDNKTNIFWYKCHDAKNDRPQEDVSGEWRFEMKIPLLAGNDVTLGVLYLVKDLRNSPLNTYTIRRIESLRRSLCVAIEKLQKHNAKAKVPEQSINIVAGKKRLSSFFARILS